jgi:hypothetical protein
MRKKHNKKRLAFFVQSIPPVVSILFSALVLLMLPFSSLQAEPIVPLYVGEVVKGEVAIYNTIKIPIKNLDEWVQQPQNNYNKFVLKIDGIHFSGLMPTLANNNTHLQFDLKRPLEAKDAWKALLSRKPIQAEKEVAVSVYQDNTIVYGEAMALMRVFDLFWLNIFITISSLAVLLFWVLAYKSDVLRVSGQQPSGNRRKPYSLARTQMAFWFFTIIISYMFIWMVTRDLSILTPSVLGLMGLSAATGLGSAMMDANKQQEKEYKYDDTVEKLQALEINITQLNSEIEQMHLSRSALPDIALEARSDSDPLTIKEATLAAKKKALEDTKMMINHHYLDTKPRVSFSFLRDILSDNKGYSFHRVQMFAWTVVLIVIFISSVFSLLAMPDFDTTLLGLVGISGATYLGFKFPNQEG